MREDAFRSPTDRYPAEWLMDECQVEATDHHIVVPRHKIGTFFTLLSKGRSFIFGRTQEKLSITPQPAKPILKVIKEPSGNISLSVKYNLGHAQCDLGKNDLIVETPLWVRNGDNIFEIEAHEIFQKWPLLKKGVLSLSPHQAHDFLFNQVPRLKQELQVDIDKTINVRESSKNIHPHFVIDISLEPKRVVLTPQVFYLGQGVPLFKEIKDDFLFFKKDEDGNG